MSLILTDSFCNPGLRLNFLFFFADSLNGVYLSKLLLKNPEKSFKSKAYIIISCGKVPGYFLQIPFKRVNVKISKIYIGSIYSFCPRLLPSKFSRMIKWGIWSETKVVMLPERCLKGGLFTKILFINVADFSVTLVGRIICDIKLWLNSNWRKLYGPLLPGSRVLLFSWWFALSIFWDDR